MPPGLSKDKASKNEEVTHLLFHTSAVVHCTRSFSYLDGAVETVRHTSAVSAERPVMMTQTQAEGWRESRRWLVVLLDRPPRMPAGVMLVWLLLQLVGMLLVRPPLLRAVVLGTR